MTIGAIHLLLHMNVQLPEFYKDDIQLKWGYVDKIMHNSQWYVQIEITNLKGNILINCFTTN